MQELGSKAAQRTPTRGQGWRWIAIALALCAVPMDLAHAEAVEVQAVAAAGSVDAIPSGPSVAERLVEIRRRIQRSVIYPVLARQKGLGGVVRIEFEIDPRGFAHDIRVAHSSGYGLLDRAAERGVAEAGSLPWVYGQLEVPVRFDLHASR